MNIIGPVIGSVSVIKIVFEVRLHHWFSQINLFSEGLVDHFRIEVVDRAARHKDWLHGLGDECAPIEVIKPWVLLQFLHSSNRADSLTWINLDTLVDKVCRLSSPTHGHFGLFDEDLRGL